MEQQVGSAIPVLDRLPTAEFSDKLPMSPRRPPFFQRLRRIPLLSALLILLVLNVLFLKLDPVGQVNPDKLPAPRSWAWWAAQDYRKQETAPAVVLLGSSSMMHPIWWQEAQFRQSDVELIVDHQCTYLERTLEQSLQRPNLSCFNFALPGAMVSDFFIVARSMFPVHKPKLVVIGVAPRDVIDNTFHCPAGTRHYKYLSRFVDTKPFYDLSIPEIGNRPQYWLQDALYFKGKSREIEVAASALALNFMQPLLRKLPSSPLDQVTEDERRNVIYKDELQRGFWVAKPNNVDRYLDVAWDCKRKLGKPNNHMFENQKTWLRMCLETCRENGAKVLVVNMPATDAVRKLIAPGAYERHVALLQQTSREFDASFLDANVPNVFKHDDFSDWAHMDASGGQKFLDLVANAILTDPRLSDALSSTTTPLAAGH